MQQGNFRTRVLVLAVVLVTTIELVTLFPVLQIMGNDIRGRARDTVAVAGTVFDEFMANRGEQLRTAANVLVSDFAFKEAAATGDEGTIASVLGNHGARIGADLMAFLDLDGRVVAQSVAGSAAVREDMFADISVAPGSSAGHSLIVVGSTAYDAVSVPLRAPADIGTVVLGFRVDTDLASGIATLTGLDISFVRWAGDGPRIIASSLGIENYSSAVSSLGPDRYLKQTIEEPAIGDVGYMTLLRPFVPDSDEFYVALQLSLDEVSAAYRRVRNLLLIIGSLSLLLAVAGSIWLAGTVTGPLRYLAHAVSRIQRGVFNEKIELRSRDEVGELADAFNAMQQAIAERTEKIEFQANHDRLSQLPNRRLCLREMSVAIEAGQPFAVVSVGIDRLDSIVSSLGHRAGDDVVRHVAKVMSRSLGGDRFLGHVGENEFVTFVPSGSDDTAERWIERIGQLLHAGVPVGDAKVSLGLNGGIARYPDHGSEATELLHHASIAAAAARARKELVSEYRIGQEQRHLRQLRLIGEFPAARESGQLRLLVQPKIEVESGRVTGAEALVRWYHPELGLLMPGEFVPALEGAGNIAHLTRWVAREAVRQCAAWRARGANLSIAINLSADDLSDQYLPYFLLELTNEYGLDCAAVTLEVTESAVMQDVAGSAATLRCIREIGFSVSIDDFGTGHSSLAQLERLAANELKIDRSFIARMTETGDETIVRTVVSLAHQMGREVVAEGVEHESTIDRLRKIGCDSAQGYFICQPMEAAGFLQWYLQRESPNLIRLADRNSA